MGIAERFSREIRPKVEDLLNYSPPRAKLHDWEELGRHEAVAGMRRYHDKVMDWLVVDGKPGVHAERLLRMLDDIEAGNLSQIGGLRSELEELSGVADGALKGIRELHSRIQPRETRGKYYNPWDWITGAMGGPAQHVLDKMREHDLLFKLGELVNKQPH